MKPLFTAEDFCHPSDRIDSDFYEQGKPHFQYMADIANAKVALLVQANENLKAESVRIVKEYDQLLDERNRLLNAIDGLKKGLTFYYYMGKDCMTGELVVDEGQMALKILNQVAVLMSEPQ